MLVRLGFSASDANDIYQWQGIDSINEWENFDKDDFFSLLRLFRKPGGSVNGEMVCFKEELNIQFAMFYIHHKIRTSRTIYCGGITVPENSRSEETTQYIGEDRGSKYRFEGCFKDVRVFDSIPSWDARIGWGSDQ